jgi:hypothetical protein
MKRTELNLECAKIITAKMPIVDGKIPSPKYIGEQALKLSLQLQPIRSRSLTREQIIERLDRLSRQLDDLNRSEAARRETDYVSEGLC